MEGSPGRRGMGWRVHQVGGVWVRGFTRYELVDQVGRVGFGGFTKWEWMVHQVGVDGSPAGSPDLHQVGGVGVEDSSGGSGGFTGWEWRVHQVGGVSERKVG